MEELFSGSLFTYLFVYVARITDMSINTVRIVFVSKGLKKQATILGFFESLIWLVAVGRIMQDLTDVGSYLAYAGGFATGNYVGMIIEKRLKIGSLIFRILTYKDSQKLQESLRKVGATVMALPAEAGFGSATLLFVVIQRRDMNQVIQRIKEYNPNAIYSIEDMRLVSESTGQEEEHTQKTSIFDRK